MTTGRRESIERLCTEMGISILYAFGSRARELYDWVEGTIQSLSPGRSDVDIGARAAPDIFWSVKEKVIIAQALEDLFDCPRVDLVVLNEADPFLAAEIVRGERLFATDTHEADEYELYVLRRAGDLLPLERERLDMILRIAQ
jgi:predicted nucleotidyltransferase